MADKGKDTEETISSPAVPQTKREIRKHTWMEWWQAAKTIKPNEIRNIEKVPCARQSLLYGIAGGTAIGCTRYLSSNPWVASNWAVASFVMISAVSWQRCQSFNTSQREQIQAIRDQLTEKSRRKTSQKDESGS